MTTPSPVILQKRPGVGFAVPGGLAIGSAAALRLAQQAADTVPGPVLLTEVSGFDALTLSAALAAVRPGLVTGTGILPLGSRTTAALAMGARTAAGLSGAPYLLGVGVSSRQIVDGWHDAPYEPSVETTRRRLAEIRQLLAGGRRGSFALPSVAAADGAAAPNASDAPDVRVLLGAMGPRMVELGLREADGVILNHTPPDALPEPVGGRLVVAYCWVVACDDGPTRIRREVTSYMTADAYARHFARLGFGDVVARVRELHAQGRLREAPALLPDALLDRLYVTPQDAPARLAEFADGGAVPVVLPVTGARPVDEVASLLDELREPLGRLFLPRAAPGA